MRYMVLLNMREDVGGPPQPLITAMSDWMHEGFASGVLVDTGGLSATADSIQYVVRGGRLTTTDGPFAEAKEVVGGYAAVEVRDDDEARELGRRMAALHLDNWPEWEGTIQVRRISGPDEGPPPRD